jgi:hypothetical protein
MGHLTRSTVRRELTVYHALIILRRGTAHTPQNPKGPFPNFSILRNLAHARPIDRVGLGSNIFATGISYRPGRRTPPPSPLNGFANELTNLQDRGTPSATRIRAKATRTRLTGADLPLPQAHRQARNFVESRWHGNPLGLALGPLGPKTTAPLYQTRRANKTHGGCLGMPPDSIGQTSQLTPV